jgi:hypothetical protein
MSILDKENKQTKQQRQPNGEPVLMQLLPMFGCLSMTVVDDNAKSPAHSVSKEKIKNLPLKRQKSRDRWESAAAKTVFPTSNREEMFVDEVKQPLRRPSVDKEALTIALSGYLESKWDLTKPPMEKSCPESSFRSSIEARKPCRRPSVDGEAILRQLAEELKGEDMDCFRSSPESKEPTHLSSLDFIEEMGESQNSIESFGSSSVQ